MPLPFLDILIDNSGDKIRTSVYHKPTYTGLLTNFNSFVPFTYKSGLIRTLVDRCFRIASDWKRFDFDFKNLVKTLGRNAFPMWLINSTVKLYLDKQFVSQNEISQNVEKQIRYFKLPYIGYSKIAKDLRIKTMVEQHCMNIDTRLIFTTSKIKDSFSTKDRLSSFSHSSKVIYKFLCASCSASYVGAVSYTHLTLPTICSV